MQHDLATQIADLYASAPPHTYVLLAIGRYNAKKSQYYGPYVKAAYRVGDLQQCFEKLNIDPTADYYLTAGTFKGGFRPNKKQNVKWYDEKKMLIHHRSMENLLTINQIVVDVDNHTDPAGNAPVNRNKILDSFKARVDDAIKYGAIPPYHACNYTGRGLQFWYSIQPVAKACRFKFDLAAPLLCALYEKLRHDDIYGLYDSLEVDVGSSKRISGLFRCPHTYNSRAKCKGHLELVSGYIAPHIDDLLHHLGIDVTNRTQTDQTESVCHSNQHKYHVTPGGSRSQPKYLPLLTKRRDLLEWLLRTKHIHVGRRNNLVFLYYNTVSQLYGADKVMATKAMMRFNSSLDAPLAQDVLNATKKKVDHLKNPLQQNWETIKKDADNVNGAYYLFKQKTFFAYGKISAEERALFEMQYKPAWKKNREQIAAEHRAAKEQRNNKIRELALTGMTQRDIAQQLGIDKNTVNSVVRPNNAIDSRKAKKENQAKQIMAAIEAGKTWQEIAKSMGISMRTVARRVAEWKKMKS